jgi:beta-lactamase class A
MRVVARQGSGSIFNAPWPAGLAAACVAVAASAVYLCLSVTQAIQPQRAGEPGSLVFISNSGKTDGSASLVSSTDEGARTDPAVSTPSPLPPGVTPLTPSRALLDAISRAAGTDGDHISVSVKRLTDGMSASFNGDVRFYAASTFKLAVLYEAGLRLARGELHLDDRLVMTDADAGEDLGTSAFLHFEDDGSITVQNLLQPMIEVSDNSSAVTLLHALGSSNVDSTLRSLGIGTMTVNHEELWTTADDLARLMEVIYTGEGVTPEVRDMMRSFLLGQTIRTGIPQALGNQVAEGLRVGNKTGTWEGAQHDIAFVEAANGPYVIAVLTDGSYEGWQAMHRVAQSVQQSLANAS